MATLRGIAALAIFVALVALALQNSDLVALRFYGFGTWQAPLVFVVLAAFTAGAAFGLLISLATHVRHRRQIGRLKRELRETPGQAPATSESLSAPSQLDRRR